MKHRSRTSGGFTLVELVLVIVVLSVLAAVAVPKFMDFGPSARNSVMHAVNGRAEEGMAVLKGALATGSTTGLPPDADDNGFVDHLGDTGPGEPTLLDAILSPPLRPEARGWKQYTLLDFPANGGRHFLYIYDTDGDEALDYPAEGFILYDNVTGLFWTYAPPL